MNECDRKDEREILTKQWGCSKVFFHTGLNLIHSDACSSSPKTRLLEVSQIIFHGASTLPHHHPYEGSLQRRGLCRPWGQLSDGAELKADQMLWCLGVYVGKEFESLNINITTEVSRIKQDNLGSVHERGRDFREVQVCVSACAHIYMYLCTCICVHYLSLPFCLCIFQHKCAF